MEKDLDAAFKIYQQQWMLNSDNIKGRGFVVEIRLLAERGHEASLQWLTEQAETGNISALDNLATMYNYGWGVEKDLGKTSEFYQQMYALSDESDGLYNSLDNIRLLAERGHEASLYWLTEQASVDNIDALFSLAIIYNYGLGAEKDLGKAFELYQRMHTLDNESDGLYQIRLLAERGHEASLHWLIEQAEADNVDALYNLAYQYKHGRGVEKDLEKAFELYQRIHTLEDDPGSLYNSVYYIRSLAGNGHEGAVRWLAKQIEVGDKEAASEDSAIGEATDIATEAILPGSIPENADEL